MKSRSTDLKKFIAENSALFWYTPQNKKMEISDELLLETIINYGDLNLIKRLFRLIGIKNARQIFLGMKGRKVNNFYPELYHFFNEYFKRIA